MASSRIGALRVDLGANTAAFEKGLTKAERRMMRFSRRMKVTGKKIAGIGKTLSVGITAPVVAAAGAFGTAAHKIAADSRDIANSARLAGEGFEEFQRQAFAARSVGIETEKLADIFKDTRERVGEFVVTGSGPLQDAFDALNGKVKLTVDELRGLSGKDALQLIVARMQEAKLSSEEMSFVLESLGSDATALIPLLKDGAKGFEELGEGANVISEEDAQSLEKYNKAMAQVGQALQEVTIAVVNSGLLDTITSLAKQFASFTSSLADTNPILLRTGVVVAGLAAALGPLLVAIGSVMTIAPAVAKGFALIKTAMVALLAHPVLLAAAAVVTGIYLAWENWDKIQPIIDSVGEAISNWYTNNVKPTFDSVMAILEPFIQFFKNTFLAAITGPLEIIARALEGDFSGAWRAAQNLVFGIARAINNVVMNLGASIARIMGQIVSSIAQRAGEIFDSVLQMGRDIISGLVQGITNNAAAVWNAIKKVVMGGIDWAKNMLGIASPSKVFKQIGVDTTDGFAIGIESGLPRVNEAMGGLGEGIEALADNAEIQTVRVAETFEQMVQNVLGSVRGLVDGIKSGDFLSILEGVFGIFSRLGSGGVFGSGIQSFLQSTTFGGARASGGPVTAGKTYLVGEQGPELFKAGVSGHIVSNDNMRSASNIQVVPSPYFDVVVDGRIVRSAPAMANMGANLAGARMAQANYRRVR